MMSSMSCIAAQVMKHVTGCHGGQVAEHVVCKRA